MALNFLFKKYKDYYVLTNTGSVTLTYTVKSEFCEEITTISTDTITVGVTKDILLTKDGKYQFVITDGSETTTVHVMYYDKLVKSIVRGVEVEICGCGCAGCNDCDGDEDNCQAQLFTLNKMLAYSFLTKPQYSPYIDAIAAYMRCKLDDAVLCLMNRERLTGETNLEGIYNQFIAVHYLAFYLADLQASADDEETAFINAKYKSSKILPCLRKKCIDVEAIKDLIDNMGTISIISGAYINQPPSSVGNNTINVLNRATTVLTLAMFTTDTTPAYADPENDPVENLRINTISGSNVGVFYYSGVPIVVGQIIPASGITAGNLTHESPDQNSLATDSFTYSLSDTGSHTYTPA